MNRDELGYCVWVLTYRLWDSPITTPPRQSRKWWKERKRKLIEGTSVCETILNSNHIEPPIPLEVEFNMPNLNYEMLLKSWKRIN